jgi:hypothetical protein
MRSKRCVVALAATAALVIAMPGGAEERISHPDSGPLGALTYGLNVAETGHGDVAVWYVSSSVLMSTIDMAGVPSEAVRVGLVGENRPPQILGEDESVDVYWADQGTLYTRRHSVSTLDGDEPRVVATGVDYPSVARNGGVTAIMVEPYVLGSTFTGSVLLLLDENGNEARRVLVWDSNRAMVAPLGDGFVSMLRTVGGVFLKRLTKDGEILDATPIRVANTASTVAFAASGTRAWVVTRASVASAPFEVTAIDAAGEVVVSRALTAPVASPTTNGVALAAKPDGLVVLAGLDDDVWRLRVGLDGSESAPPRLVVDTPGRQWARGISSGSRELVFWSEAGQRDILVQQEDREARVLTIGGSSASGLSATAASESVLVAWRDHLGSAHAYRYSMLDPSGRPAGEPVTFDSGDGFNGDPQVAWSGEELGILWHANQRTQLIRLGPDGTPRGAPTTLPSIPSSARLSGGHGRLVALWSAGGAIVASILGAEGASVPVAVTTPIVPPPNAVSGDGTPILLATPDDFELVYENTIYYECVGIPCPTRTSVIALRLSNTLEPEIDSRVFVASDTRLTDAAVSDGVLGVLTRQTDIEFHTVPRTGGGASRRTIWQRTGWQPVPGGERIAPRPSGFGVAIRELLAPIGWTSFHEVGLDGAARDLRVLSGRTGQTKIVRAGSTDLVIYSRLEGTSTGSSLYSERWGETPRGPAPPATPLRIVARLLSPPFIEVTWTYEGPPLVAFTISPGTFENVTIVPPDKRSIVFVPTRKQLRVVAINEAGSAVSKTVEPKHERTRGARP